MGPAKPSSATPPNFVISTEERARCGNPRFVVVLDPYFKQFHNRWQSRLSRMIFERAKRGGEICGFHIRPRKVAGAI